MRPELCMRQITKKYKSPRALHRACLRYIFLPKEDEFQIEGFDQIVLYIIIVPQMINPKVWWFDPYCIASTVDTDLLRNIDYKEPDGVSRDIRVNEALE